jgi:hypothetical protein
MTERRLNLDSVDTEQAETEDPKPPNKNIEIIKEEIAEKYWMGDIGLIEHEAKKVHNLITTCFFLLVCSLMFLFMGLLVFIIFSAFSEFIVSFMICASFITILFELIILWPLACVFISIVYKLRNIRMVNLARKTQNFQHTHAAYPKSYISSLKQRKRVLKEEEMEIPEPNDSDGDRNMKGRKKLHTSFEGLSDISIPWFNPPDRLDDLYRKEDMDFFSQLGVLNLVFLN